MSCGKASFDDDLTNWVFFQEITNIYDLQSWDVYSDEAYYAVKSNKEYPVLTGKFLVDYVLAEFNKRAIIRSANLEALEYKQFFNLKAKFERVY